VHKHAKRKANLVSTLNRPIAVQAAIEQLQNDCMCNCIKHNVDVNSKLACIAACSTAQSTVHQKRKASVGSIGMCLFDLHCPPGAAVYLSVSSSATSTL
jgi:hypothetical protein